jgi:hypothetical protein
VCCHNPHGSGSPHWGLSVENQASFYFKTIFKGPGSWPNITIIKYIYQEEQEMVPSLEERGVQGPAKIIMSGHTPTILKEYLKNSGIGQPRKIGRCLVCSEYLILILR